MTESPSPTLVLVHGAWHGAWCWDRVLPGLAQAGVPLVAIDLPGHGASRAPLADLTTDAAALRDAIEAVGGPVVVAGHSYGGAVVSVGAVGLPNVRHLVFVAAFPLDVGESCMNAAAGEVPEGAGESLLVPALRFHDDGTSTLDPDLAVPALYNECTPADARWAVARLGPQAADELQGVATAAAWHDTPSTYVLCTRDQGVTPPLQRALAARCNDVTELDADHSPFLSRPDELVALLTALTRAADPAPIARTKG